MRPNAVFTLRVTQQQHDQLHHPQVAAKLLFNHSLKWINCHMLVCNVILSIYLVKKTSMFFNNV